MLDCEIIGFRDTNKRCCYITPFSLIHILSGVALNLVFKKLHPNLRYKFYYALTIHTIYELKDMYINYKTDGPFYTNKWAYKKSNTLGNSIGDTFAFILGYYIGIYVNDPIFILIYLLSAVTFYKLKIN
tara:strand:- start:4 stop:390 length:387 start_codon:yes stop_codon:yes gene_type:complete